jgi:hypothetical protein
MTAFLIACSRHSGNLVAAGLGMGLNIIAWGTSFGRISGASLNPQVTTSLQLVHCFAAGVCSPMKYWPVYCIAELLAAVVAFVVYCLLGQWDTDKGDGPIDDTANVGERTSLIGAVQGSSATPSYSEISMKQ